MTGRCVPVTLFFAVMTVAAGREADACSCGITNPCQAAGYADAIFSGTVVSVEMASPNTGAAQQFITVRMDVDENFVNATQRVATLTMDLSSCTYSFKAGQRYLVYAYNKSGYLTTSSCSRTRPLADAADDLRYLSSMRNAANASRIHGQITESRRHPAEDQSVDYGPLEGITVTVRSSGFVGNSVTGADGRYEIANLPAAKATMSILFPFGYEPESFEQDVDLADTKACREFNFAIRPVARASGFVVDSSGRPLAGVSIDAVAAELAGFDPRRYQYPATSDERGWFEFTNLPPGSYVFGVNLTKETYGKLHQGAAIFLPGTSIANEAAVFELKAGDRKDVGTLRVTVR